MLVSDTILTKLWSNWRIFLLVTVLPFFGQTVHYMKDVPPLWMLSKAFPLLSLPLAVALLTRRRVPLSLSWLCAFLWLLVTPSFIGMFTFNQSFILGLTAQVKLLPMLYMFSFLGLLLVIRPSAEQLLTAFVFCGVITFSIIFLLWAFAPQSWYVTRYDFGDAPLLSADDRGNRIRMPLFFGVVTVFALYRQLLTRPSWRAGVLLAVALALIVGVVRTRAVVLGIGATFALVTLIAAPRGRRAVALVAAALGALLLIQVPYVQSAFDTSRASGFDLREVTADKAASFLGPDPLRWLLGAGTLSPLVPGGLAKFFNHFFFLADISWLGVIFEFGLVGAGIIVYLLVRTWLFGAEVGAVMDSPRVAGLQDYVLFTLVQSPLYSTMTLQPGEIAIIAASFAYFAIILRDQSAREQQCV